MFGFLFHRKRQEVRKALTSRINHKCVDQVRHANRAVTRTAICEVLWLIPDGDLRDGFADMVPAVSKDISPQGIAVIHTEPVTDSRITIGLEGQHGPTFIRANVEHCTSLGYGFYQIGLHPDEVLNVSYGDLSQWQHRLREYGGHAAVKEPVGIGC